MKRYILFFMLLIVLFMSACLNNNTALQPNISASTYIETEDIYYKTFEELLGIAGHIVKAKYIETINHENHFELIFKIEKQYKGEIKDDYLHVYINDITFKVYRRASKFQYDCKYVFDNHKEYISGQSYILVLERHTSVYYEYDKFKILAGLYIPIEDLKNSNIYGQEKLFEHSSSITAIHYLDGFENYISDVILRFSSSEIKCYGIEYIDSDDIEVIVNKSDYIVRLIPKSEDVILKDGTTAIYNCELLMQYKGDINKTNIKVRFLLDSVDLNNEYIVALDYPGISALYIISSKKSVMSVDNETQIIKLISKDTR